MMSVTLKPTWTWASRSNNRRQGITVRTQPDQWKRIITPRHLSLAFSFRFDR